MSEVIGIRFLAGARGFSLFHTVQTALGLFSLVLREYQWLFKRYSCRAVKLTLRLHLVPSFSIRLHSRALYLYLLLWRIMAGFLRRMWIIGLRVCLKETKPSWRDLLKSKHAQCLIWHAEYTAHVRNSVKEPQYSILSRDYNLYIKDHFNILFTLFSDGKQTITKTVYANLVLVNVATCSYYPSWMRRSKKFPVNVIFIFLYSQEYSGRASISSTPGLFWTRPEFVKKVVNFAFTVIYYFQWRHLQTGSVKGWKHNSFSLTSNNERVYGRSICDHGISLVS